MAFTPPVIDNFTTDGSMNGRTANPGGQTWTAPLFTGHTALTTAGGLVTGVGGSDRSAVISSAEIGPDCQMGLTIVTKSGSQSTILYMRVQQDSFPFASGSADMYVAHEGAGNLGLTVIQYIAGSPTTIGTIGSHAWASGDKMGFELVESGGNTNITGYFDSGSGWTSLGTGLIDSTAGRPTAAGHVGVEIDSVADVIDDFAAQTSPVLAAAILRDFSRLPKKLMVSRP